MSKKRKDTTFHEQDPFCCAISEINFFADTISGKGRKSLVVRPCEIGLLCFAYLVLFLLLDFIFALRQCMHSNSHFSFSFVFHCHA